jgi:hypothetical protein
MTLIPVSGDKGRASQYNRTPGTFWNINVDAIGRLKSAPQQKALKRNPLAQPFLKWAGGRKGGLVKSRKKKIAARLNARRPRSGRRKNSSKS